MILKDTNLYSTVFQMIVTHERRFLDLIERILERLDADSSRQAEIETKFSEVQEGALDEVSFRLAIQLGGCSICFGSYYSKPCC